MPLETSKIPIYVAIGLILLSLAIFFAPQFITIAEGFFQSLEIIEHDVEEEDFEYRFTYITSSNTVAQNLENILTNFDPQSRLVYCNIPEDYFDSDSSDEYMIMCDSIIFDVPEDEIGGMTYTAMYRMFTRVFTDEWTSDTFSDKDLTIAQSGPRQLEISSYDYLNYEDDCWSEAASEEIFNTGYEKIFVRPPEDDSVSSPSDPKLKIRIMFEINEDDETFNPIVTFCPNVVRQ